jgi:RimJ/RimL family protein N-acetyltransferase
VVRFFRQGDAEQIRDFRCSQRKWEREAQRVIRESPSLPENYGIEILVADLNGEVVGVAVFKVFDLPACMIYSLGVVNRLWDSGIGTRLKQAVIVEATSRNPGCIFGSKVFKRNHRMIHVNEKFHAETATSPDDPEFLFTIVTATIE